MAHTAAFTPANTSHTAGDCVGAATAIGTLGVEGEYAMIVNASLLISSSAAVASAWRLHLYSVTPPSATADDSPWDIASGDRASYLGYVDIGTTVDVGSSQYIEAVNLNKVIRLDGQIYGYLMNVSTVTLAAVAHTVKIEAVYI